MRGIFIIGLLFAVVLVSGCAQPGTETTTTTTTIMETTTTTLTEGIGGVTEGGLDDLKSDLEDLEFEDLGGLASEQFFFLHFS